MRRITILAVVLLVLLAAGALGTAGAARSSGSRTEARVVVRPVLAVSTKDMGQALVADVRSNSARPYTLTLADHAGRTLWQGQGQGPRRFTLPQRSGTLTLVAGY